MSAEPVEPAPEALVASVRLVRDPARELELATRLPDPSAARTLSVTDLLDPRPAFWRRKGPVAIAAGRRARLELGREWHHRLSRAVAGDGRLEVRLRRSGISARIDLLADVPVEVKTSSAGVPGAVPPDRPEQVAQLAAYCALSQRPVGRLVHLAVHDGELPRVFASDLEFRDLGPVERDLARRAEALRQALREGLADRLDRCRWFDLGCDYRAAGVCDCRGDEPEAAIDLGTAPTGRNDRADLAGRWERLLTRTSGSKTPTVERYRDLLYPRRTYYDHRVGRPPVSAAAGPWDAPADAYERTWTSLESGPVGDVHTLPARAPAPVEEVVAWRGRPCLLRVGRTRAPLLASEIPARYPQYLIDLGARCAHTGVPRATLIVGREAPEPGESPVEVFDVDFPTGVAPFAEWWEARLDRLERALQAEDPGSLPRCPGWMVDDCPYRAVCGCGDSAERSQR